MSKYVLNSTSQDSKAGTSVYDSPQSIQQTINICDEYPWTVTPQSARSEVPQLTLREYRMDQSMIVQQEQFYQGAGVEIFDKVKGALTGQGGAPTDSGSGRSNPLSVYDGLWGTKAGRPTGLRYVFPFFSDVNMEVSTGDWTAIDGLEAAKSIASGFSKFRTPQSNSESNISKIAGVVMDAGAAAASFYSPVVGIMDRPRLFASHNNRSLSIKFPLFNTLDANDWIANRDFIFLFMNQNLYSKTSFMTGEPPCWYRLTVLGQYYCHAASVTNIQINNRGNIRRLKYGTNLEIPVPDIYEVNITFSEMVMPSSNQLQAATNKAVIDAV